MLRMANEIEGITRHTTLDTINKSIKELENAIAKQNKSIEEQAEKLRLASEKQLSSLDNQLASLEAQRKDLINASTSQINRMGDLLGKNSPIVKYLIDMLEALKNGKAPNHQENAPKLPENTTPDNIKTGYTVIGKKVQIGDTEAKFELKTLDFSKINQDAWGNTHIVQGKTAKYADVNVIIPTRKIDQTKKTLERAIKPTLFIGDERENGFESLAILGYYDDFTISSEDFTFSQLKLSIKGVI